MPLHRFHGGLRLAGQKLAAAQPIRRCPVPSQLVLPLAQHAGLPACCVVEPGQALRRGQPIARAVDGLSASVHASSSGRVLAIEDRPVPHASGLAAPCVVLETDGRDESVCLPALGDDADVDILLQRLDDCGVVGLGGAGFPSAAKLAQPRHTLILNGAECEPYIACDDGLMREHADGIVAGARLLQRICNASSTLVAIEDSMVEAIAALQAALRRVGDPCLSLILVPTIYPQGGERQLIRVLTGREVPSGSLPRDIGIICHNVATAYAAWRAIALGEALTSRIVSVGGSGVRAPGNYEVRLGTSLEFLLTQAGGLNERAARLVIGGPMMGYALPHADYPLIKTSNSVLVLAADEVRAVAPEMPCIRCGECVRVCPAQLMPQQLFEAIRLDDSVQASELGLQDCIECGCCAYVCPSQIPLVDWYRHGKSEIAAQHLRLAQANTARERYEARNLRLARDQAERVARVSSRTETVAVTSDVAAPVTAPAGMDKAAVLAAIARGRARRKAARDTTTPTDPDGSDDTAT